MTVASQLKQQQEEWARNDALRAEKEKLKKEQWEAAKKAALVLTQC